MTDWFAVTETTVSLGAGLDLEMPGPARGLGSAVVDAIKKGDVDEADLDAAVGRLLGGLDRIGALDGPAPEPDPKVPTPGDVDAAPACRGRGDGACSRTTASCRWRPRPRRHRPARCARA